MFPYQFQFVEIVEEVVDLIYLVFFYLISPHIDLDM